MKSITNFSQWWDEAAKKAGIDGVTGYTIDWNNDVGPLDDSYWEWWEVKSPSGGVICKCDKEQFAIMLCALLNEAGKQ